MFGFDLDDLFNGYSKQDEFIARDIIVLNILVDKGIITSEEIEERFKQLPDIIKNVKDTREKEVHRRADEAHKRLEEYKKGEDSMSNPCNLNFNQITNDLIGDCLLGKE